MAAGPHTFVVLDVFTQERYLGNQLSVVSVRNNVLSRQRKQQIAKEFGYATTAFLHDAQIGQPRKIELYSPGVERRFAADAVLGTAHYIFQKLNNEDLTLSAPSGVSSPPHAPPRHLTRCALQTASGTIQASYDPSRQIAAVEVPHDIHVHARETPKDEILAVQRKLVTNPQSDKMKGSYSVVSIVPGLTYTLVDFTTCPTLMALLRPGEAPEPDLYGGWNSASTPASPADELQQPKLWTWATSAPTSPNSATPGAVYFVQLQTDFTEEPYITRLQVRVISEGSEDAATASGCCALAVYLALQKGGKNSRHAYAIEQGVQMGRPSQLCIEVRLNEHGTGVSRITLSGRATFVMEGRLL